MEGEHENPKPRLDKPKLWSQFFGKSPPTVGTGRETVEHTTDAETTPPPNSPPVPDAAPAPNALSAAERMPEPPRGPVEKTEHVDSACGDEPIQLPVPTYTPAYPRPAPAIQISAVDVIWGDDPGAFWSNIKQDLESDITRFSNDDFIRNRANAVRLALQDKKPSLLAFDQFREDYYKRFLCVEQDWMRRQ